MKNRTSGILRPSREMQQNGEDDQIGGDLNVDHGLGSTPALLGDHFHEAVQQIQNSRIVEQEQHGDRVERRFPHRYMEDAGGHERATCHGGGSNPSEPNQPIGTLPQIIFFYRSLHFQFALHDSGMATLYIVSVCLRDHAIGLAAREPGETSGRAADSHIWESLGDLGRHSICLPDQCRSPCSDLGVKCRDRTPDSHR